MVVPFSKKIAADAGSCCDRPRLEVALKSRGSHIGLEETAMHSNLWERSEKTERKV